MTPDPLKWFVAVAIGLTMALVFWRAPAPLHAQNPQAPVKHAKYRWVENITTEQTVALVQVDATCYLWFIVYGRGATIAPAFDAREAPCPVP